MLKITDPAYKLSTYLPLSHQETLTSGRTAPLLVRGVCTQTSQKDDIVVKLSDSTMSNDAKCREIIAAFIARELGILVAEPVLVEISNEVLLAFKEPSINTRMKNAIGINFGSKWAGDGYSEFVNPVKLPPILVEQALYIFIFDTLIHNADRRAGKQNLKNNGREIVIFDHESAFGFVFDIFPRKDSWVLNEMDKKWIKNHLFYKEIRNKYTRFDVSKEIDKFKFTLEKLDNSFWNKVKGLIPISWKGGHNQIVKIENFLSSITQNTDKFLEQLKTLLQ